MVPFYVGQEVVCVDATVKLGNVDPLVENQIYRIRWIGPFVHFGQECIAVRLEGIIRGRHGDDMPFYAKRFRPLTNISIFQKMLKTQELEDA